MSEEKNDFDKYIQKLDEYEQHQYEPGYFTGDRQLNLFDAFSEPEPQAQKLGNRANVTGCILLFLLIVTIVIARWEEIKTPGNGLVDFVAVLGAVFIGWLLITIRFIQKVKKQNKDASN